MYHKEEAPERKGTPNMLDQADIRISQAAVAGLEGLKDFLEDRTDAVRDFTARVLSDKSPKGPLDSLVFKAVQAGKEMGRDFRAIDKVDRYHTPKLLDDVEADLLLKSDIVSDLDSRIGINAPFIEEIERIGTTCFDRGIPAERLKAFLESDEVLDFLIREVLNREDSVYRGENIKALAASFIESMIGKLKKRVTRVQKTPVTDDVEDSIKGKIAYFGEEYDPHDKAQTIANFIKELEKTFSEYDVLGWLSEHRELLIALTRGNPAHAKRHVGTIIDEVYTKRGQINPDQFIKLHVDEFFQVYDPSKSEDIPPFMVKSLGIDKKDLGGVIVIDLKKIEDFFDEIMEKLQNGGESLMQLRDKLVSICIERLKSNNGAIKKIIFAKNGICSFEDFDSVSDAEERLTEEIVNNCRTVSSHVDVRNLLSDPAAIPPEIAKNYEEWFDENGKLNTRAYYSYIRSVFGQMVATRDDDEDEALVFTSERFENIRERVTELFDHVMMYLGSISSQLGLPDIQVPLVREMDDYSELVKICCTSKDPQETFAARRKIELAFLVYSCLTTPRFVYQKYEAQAVKKVLERKGGVKLLDEEDIVLRFVDNKDGTIEDISDEHPRAKDERNVKNIDLIPAIFAGVKCGLLPANGTPGDYMSKKTINSMLTNLLNEENKRAKDMTDILRMTFVVDSMEDLVKVQQHLETDYISFGRSIKREDRYAKTASREQVAVSGNASKSSDYKALRYVVDVIIPDENSENYEKGHVPTYAVPVEIRVLLREDIMKERSEFHPASHKKYEKKRSERIVPALAPKKVFPDHYVTEKPHKDDVFGKKVTRLRTNEQLGKAA
jgi:hypothetical protein